ncbi:hypothetical protein LTR78_010648 [Recurvomyces mirabilis]|uniref:Uncharacterized protein n=1 Tax=Recurvomyces mirabilis TaxID=574656 RepID=A0AAE0TPN5_9PEZI|nr:hypothetical protein LTR78_010648 [Recurvomyces mirabilis]
MTVAESRSPEDIWQLNLDCDKVVVSYRQVLSKNTPPSRARVDFRHGALGVNVERLLRTSSCVTVQDVFRSLIAKGYGQTSLWSDGVTGNGFYILLVAFELWNMFCLGEESNKAFQSLVKAVSQKSNEEGQATGPAALGLPIGIEIPSGFPLVQLPLSRHLVVEE